MLFLHQLFSKTSARKPEFQQDVQTTDNTLLMREADDDDFVFPDMVLQLP